MRGDGGKVVFREPLSAVVAASVEGCSRSDTDPLAGLPTLTCDLRVTIVQQSKSASRIRLSASRRRRSLSRTSPGASRGRNRERGEG